MQLQPPYAFYVATDGNDANKGTQASPFLTPQRARDAIRELKAKGEFPDIGVSVYFRGGDYSLPETFALDERDSGTRLGDVVYKAYPGEEVCFLGGSVLDAKNFYPVEEAHILNRLPACARGKVLCYDLRSDGIQEYGVEKPHGFAHNTRPAPMELFMEDEAMTLARYPKKGQYILNSDCTLLQDSVYEPYGSGKDDIPARFQMPYAGVKRWKNPQEVWISGCIGWGYSDDTLPVESITKDGVVTLKAANYSGFQQNVFNKHFYENILEELSEAGEYYIDRQEGKLYFYPPEGYEHKKLTVSMLEEPLLALEGCSFVSFYGITLECGRGMGVYMERGEQNKLVNCTIKNMGTAAVSIGKSAYSPKDCMHEFRVTKLLPRIVGNIKGILYEAQEINREGGYGHTVFGCNIRNTGAGGIWCGAGDRATLTPCNISIISNEIHDVNRREWTYKPLIWLDGVGITVAHNHLYNAPCMAVHLMGNDHVVAYNNIHHCVQDADDQAAIYAGRNASELGFQILYNYIHEIGADSFTPQQGQQAVFWDDGEINATIVGNVFYKAGTTGVFKTNLPSFYSRFDNNILIDCPTMIEVFGPGPCRLRTDYNFEGGLNADLQLYRDRSLGDVINVTGPLFIKRYPYIKNLLDADTRSNTAKNNVLVNSRNMRKAEQSIWSLETPFVTDNPKFVNWEAQDFSLCEDSPVYSSLPGFEPVPFHLMGRLNDWMNQQVKELTAFVVNRPFLLQNGAKGLMDETDLDAVARIIHNNIYVPEQFAANMFDIEPGKMPADDFCGRRYLPLRELAKNAGYTLFVDGSGLIVLSQKGNIFDSKHDKYLIQAILYQTLLS